MSLQRGQGKGNLCCGSESLERKESVLPLCTSPFSFLKARRTKEAFLTSGSWGKGSLLSEECTVSAARKVLEKCSHDQDFQVRGFKSGESFYYDK